MYKCGMCVLAMFALVHIASEQIAVGQNTAPSREARPQPSVSSSVSLEALRGQWIRPDGGYVIVVKGFDSSGKLDATYFNPNQLPFSRAEATLKDNTINVFLELRAGGYAGSNYNLAYDPITDQLNGIYYQAVAQQRFNIFFIRVR